jgi:4-hydroxybenzoate polyprenyltransferase
LSRSLRKQNPAANEAQADLPPLCVDLDGTLIRSDTLIETALLYLFRHPFMAFQLLLWLLKGKAFLKSELARRASLNVATLPYNAPFVDYLRKEKAAGRRIVLATAADKHIAEAVAAHIDCFDEVIASEKGRNLKGEAKAESLVERFGERGFLYAGNDHPDVAIWSRAAGAIPVSASAKVTRLAKAAAPIEAVFDDRGSRIVAFIRAIRPYQWAKNFLVFVPVITSGDVLNMGVWLSAMAMFVAFSLTASGIYLVNDLADLQADRHHPRKQKRPFASGELSLLFGIAAAPAMVVTGCVIAALLGSAWVILIYAALSISYSFKLKQEPLIDIFILAALYTLRLFAGGEAIDHPVSYWLLAFSGFFFLGLALIKRLSELMASDVDQIPRRGYRRSDRTIVQQMSVGAGFVACMILALYVQSAEVAERYADPALLWAIVPLVLFWQCHVWLATARGTMHDDPLVFAARDRVSQAIVLAAGVVMTFAMFP